MQTYNLHSTEPIQFYYPSQFTDIKLKGINKQNKFVIVNAINVHNNCFNSYEHIFN